ncbi:KICSTOR complex protein ITFG2-like isoform X2 [Tigriopus californicus]|uniref:KICSTOR complex protein ITFG2-like isoform X2 n=1 Tax=Tigriopus californicus TaxID=6832 RepID=UPI0027DA9B9F|nr:KICSTOR complex protein ITFG2-like isoform X2 [Tigriopus californicus]
MIKSFSLPDCLVLRFTGTVQQNAICLADVDNDGQNELIVGNSDGTLAVYKELSDEPWRVCHDLGMISAVCVGDMRNDGTNVLVVIDGSGWFYILDFNATYEPRLRVTKETCYHLPGDVLDRLSDSVCSEQPMKNRSMERHSSGDSALDLDQTECLSNPEIIVSGSENLPIVPEEDNSAADQNDLRRRETSRSRSISQDRSSANRTPSGSHTPHTGPPSDGDKNKITASLDSDTPNDTTRDSMSESDTSSHHCEHNSIHVWYRQRVPANIREVLIFDLNNDGINEVVMALTDRVVRTYQWHPSDPVNEELKEKAAILRMQKARKHGRVRRRRLGTLKPVQKWEFGNQIGSITRNRNHDGTNALILAQPGGGMLKLISKSGLELKEDDSPEELMAKIGEVNCSTLSINEMRNFTTSAEIKGNLLTQEAITGQLEVGLQSTPYAVVTMAGTVMFVKDDSVVWTVETEKPLFCARSLAMGADQPDYVVVAGWSGYTFFFDQNGKHLEFMFDQSVATFTCGPFYSDGANRPTLVYTTVDGEIFLYYNLKPLERESYRNYSKLG